MQRYLDLHLYNNMGRAFEFRKARKMKRWSNMSKTFTRIGREIIIAVKESGPDPSSNSRLRAIIQNAKAANMPKDNIERAIKKASEKSSENFKEVLLEGYAPHGIAILVEAATDNNNRTVANIRSYFNKCDGSLATSGSVDFLFDHLCFFQIKDQGIDIEELELDLIDFGVIELSKLENEISITARFEDFGSIQKELERRGFGISSSEFEREAKINKTLTEDERLKVERLINMIDEDEDVQNVYHDMKTID
jgi:YebC/PmpR family DNA-binding regulatory protein